MNGLTSYGWPKYSTDGQTLVKLAFQNNTGLVLGPSTEYDVQCSGVLNATGPATTTAPPSSTPTNGAVGYASPPLRLTAVLGSMALAYIL
jgi:hypothetical protein